MGYGHPKHYNTRDYSVSKKNSGHFCILYFFLCYKNCILKIDVKAIVRTFFKCCLNSILILQLKFYCNKTPKKSPYFM